MASLCLLGVRFNLRGALRSSIFGLCFLALCLPVLNVNAPPQPAAGSTGKLRQYFISADEVEWNYAPHNIDHMTGKPFDKATVTWVEKGKDRIGQVYRKATYREYTDATFQTVKPRTPEYEHMGILGPVIRAKIGDTLEIVFRNNTKTKQPYGIDPHGVSYTKDSKGGP